MESKIKESKDQILRRQAIERFLRYDQQQMIERYQLKADENIIQIRFLDLIYTIDRKSGELYRGEETADLDEMASIYEYLTYGENPPVRKGNWESIASLCTNTTDTSLTRYIESLEVFSGRMPELQAACEKMGGVLEHKGDVSSIIPVFEGVDTWFQYWEADDEFPASVQFLWDGDITENFRWSILWNVMTCICNRLKRISGIQEG